MAERRSLVDGLKTTSEVIERDFVYNAEGNKPKTPETPIGPVAISATNQLSRSPISTRIRSDYAEALKRTSLERQLNRIQPNSLQDILEEAIATWLTSNGCLP